MMSSDHEIYYDYRDENRTFWECSCGCSGSVPYYRDVYVASEKHVREDESVKEIFSPRW